MPIEIIRCPNCGGDVDINKKECPYCRSDLFYNDYEKRKELIKGMLTTAENDLITMSLDKCKAHLQDVIRMDRDCADAWFMYAVIYSDDSTLFNQNIQRGRDCMTSYGVFDENDVGRYVKSNKEEAQEVADSGSKKTFFLVLIIGGIIAAVIGIVFRTLVPVIILVVILALIVIVHHFLTIMCRIVE